MSLHLFQQDGGSPLPSALGIVFAMISGCQGLIVFIGIHVAGFSLRQTIKAKTRGRYADLPSNLKQDGFLYGRCEHLFVPVA